MPTVVPLYKRKQRRSAAAGVTPASTTHSTATCSPSRPSSPSFHGAGRHNDPNSGACSPITPTRSPVRALAGDDSSGDECSSSSSDNCGLCRKQVRYYPETLNCGHLYHSDCYWRWIRVRSNLPEEKSICPSCGFLPTPPPSPSCSMGGGVSYKFADAMVFGRQISRQRSRKYSSSSDSSFISSDSSSSSSTDSCSDSDIFFL